MDGPVVLRPGHPETPAGPAASWSFDGSGPAAAFGSFKGDVV